MKYQTLRHHTLLVNLGVDLEVIHVGGLGELEGGHLHALTLPLADNSLAGLGRGDGICLQREDRTCVNRSDKFE
jgi:hypothetical protein